MVVAVGQGKVGAVTAFADGVSSVVLATGDSSFSGNVVPWGVNLTTIASIKAGAEADVLSRQRHSSSGVGTDAESVAGGGGGCEGPAAPTHGLVADVANHFGTLRPVAFAIEGIGDIFIADVVFRFGKLHDSIFARKVHAKLLPEVLGVVIFVYTSLPQNVRGVVDLVNNLLLFGVSFCLGHSHKGTNH
jgi:hypothetical protein